MPFGGVEKSVLHRDKHEVAFKYLYNIFPLCFCYNRKTSAGHLCTGRNI